MQHLTFVVLEVCLATRGRAIHVGTLLDCRYVRDHGGDRGASRPRLNADQTALVTGSRYCSAASLGAGLARLGTLRERDNLPSFSQALVTALKKKYDPDNFAPPQPEHQARRVIGTK